MKRTKTNNLFRTWTVDRPRAVILLVHGLGAHSARWDFLAQYFQDQGFSSYAIELRGFGATAERPRGHIDSFKTYYRDLAELSELIKAENPGKKIFLLGESLGGLLAFLAAGQHPGEYAGLIAISPAFQNGMGFSLLTYLKFAWGIIFNQKLLLPMPFTSAMCTRDKAYQEIMNNNPAELRMASVKTLLNILFAQIAAKRLLKTFSIPLLFLLPGKDYLIDEKTNRQVFKQLTLKDKTQLEYPEMLHALSIDLGRKKVFEDIVQWLSKRT